MGFTDAIKTGFQKYIGFSGRAARSEYWYWVLFVILVQIVAWLIDEARRRGKSAVGHSTKPMRSAGMSFLENVPV